MKQTVARVGAVGPGVMRPLLFDRGLGDGATVGRLNALGVDSLFVLKAGMDLWTDAEALAGATRQRLLDARGADQKVSPSALECRQTGLISRTASGTIV